VSDRIRRAGIVVGLTYLAFVGYILGRFANAAFPTFYLYRPLALVIPLAIVVGLLAAWLARSHAPLTVGIAVGIICFWATFSRHWWQAAILVVAWLVVAVVVGLVLVLVIAERGARRVAKVAHRREGTGRIPFEREA